MCFERRLQLALASRLKARRMTQGRYLQLVLGDTIVMDDLLGDEPGVHKYPTGPVQGRRQLPLNLPQTVRRLRFGIVDMGQIMQGHDGRTTELQGPEGGLVVDMGLQAPGALVEASLHELTPEPIGPRNRGLGKPADSAITGTWADGQVGTPDQAIEQRQFQLRMLLQGPAQLQSVLAYTGAWRLQDADVKRDAHQSLRRPPAGCCAAHGR